MIVPTVIFVPSVMHDQVIEIENYVSDTYGKKANPVAITPYGNISPTETVSTLREAIRTSRFVICSWSVLSDMSTSSRQFFILDLSLECLVIEIKEHQPVRYAGRKDSVPNGLIQKLKELYRPNAEKTVSKEYAKIWSGFKEKVKTKAEIEPSAIVDLIPPKVEKPVEIIVKPSLKEKLARM